MTWSFLNDSTTPFTNVTSPIILNGTFSFSLSTSVNSALQTGFSFSSHATGISASFSDGVLVVTHPVGGQSVTDNYQFSGTSLSVSIPYTVADSNPGSGESISFSSWIQDSVLVGPSGSDSVSDTLQYSFTESVS